MLDWLARYSQLSLPLRLVISALVTLGAGVGLGFIAEYGAYNWAMYYGVRPPLEGIPFLRVAVTGLTVVVLVGGALAFLSVRFIVGAVLSQLEGLVSRFDWYTPAAQPTAPGLTMRSNGWITVYRARAMSSAFYISLGLAAVAALLLTTGAYLGRSGKVDWDVIFAASLVVWSASMALWSPKIQNWLALLATALVVFVAPFSLFRVGIYGAVLRGLGYGGGAPVTVHLVDEPNFRDPRTEVRGYLMLRTSTAVILFEPQHTRIREIPIERVLVIDQSSSIPEKSVFKLPR